MVDGNTHIELSSGKENRGPRMSPTLEQGNCLRPTIETMCWPIVLVGTRGTSVLKAFVLAASVWSTKASLPTELQEEGALKNKLSISQRNHLNTLITKGTGTLMNNRVPKEFKVIGDKPIKKGKRASETKPT